MTGRPRFTQVAYLFDSYVIFAHLHSASLHWKTL
jgi:hypothetical protein